MPIRKTKLTANSVHKLKKLWMYDTKNMPETIGDWEVYLQTCTENLKSVPVTPNNTNINSVFFNKHCYALVGLGLLQGNFDLLRSGFKFYTMLNNMRNAYQKRAARLSCKSAKTLIKRASK